MPEALLDEFGAPSWTQELTRPPQIELLDANLEPSWGRIRAKLGQVGAKLGQLGAKLGPRWPKLGPRKVFWQIQTG